MPMKRQHDTWDKIRKMPRTFEPWDNMSNNEQVQAEKYLAMALRYLRMKVHESTLRSYSILQEAKTMLEAGTPGDIVLGIIKMLETDLPDKGDT